MSLILLAIVELTFCQEKINEDFRSFVEAAKHKDLDSFYKCFISSGEYHELFKAGIIGNLDRDSLNFNKYLYSEDQKRFLADSVLEPLFIQAKDAGVRFEDAEFIDFYYTLCNSPRNLLISLTGEIVLSIDSKYFKLPITEAVYINSGWKISGSGNLIYLPTYMPNKSFDAISEYGSLKFGYKIVDVKVEEVGPKEPPPPPPPLPVKPKGKKKIEN